MKPLLMTINPDYFYKILDWKKQSYELVGSLAMLPGYRRYNYLIKLNSIFSVFPVGDPVDRTQHITGPFNFEIVRPWSMPNASLTFDKVMFQRVSNYINTGEKLNLCWSGGIDSTCLVAGFLQHTKAVDQLRIIYSPFSLYENRDFFQYIAKNYPHLEMLDISGDVYLNNTFDGIMINGHGGDEFTASLDETFFNSVGFDGLHRPWQELVRDTELQEFCKEYFALSQRPINTVLEARWWFYAATKSQVFGPRDGAFTNSAFTSSFFNCKEFEDYMWHNIDQVIVSDNYNSYKQFMKNYIYEFDGNEEHCILGRKLNSLQFVCYTQKKTELLGNQWIARLADQSTIKTPSLPLFSKLEFEQTYGESLEYLFNNIPG
jgi:hypothetical protein